MPDFGIGETIAGLLTSAGVGAETAGIIAPALVGAGEGALVSGVTGGNPLTGALTGGLTGGLTSGFGGDVASALNIGQKGADVLIGAGSGGLSGALTGGNILTDTLGGAAAGYGAAPSGSTWGAPSTSAVPSISGDLGTSSIVSPVASPVSASATPTGAGSALSGAPASPIPGAVNPANLGGGLTPPGGEGGPASIPSVGGGAGATSGIPGLGTTGPSAVGLSDKLPSVASNAGGGGSVSGGAGDWLSKAVSNPFTDLSAINTALGIQQTNKAQGALDATVAGATKQAASAASGATGLESFISTGQIPTGAKAVIDQATAASKAQIRQKYQGLGLSGSTMEALDLSNVDQQAAGQVNQVATNLFNSGIQLSGISKDLLDAILAAQGNKVTASTTALQNYAAAISGGAYAPKTG